MVKNSLQERPDTWFTLAGHRLVERKSLTLVYCHDCRQCNVEEWFVAVHPRCERPALRIATFEVGR